MPKNEITTFHYHHNYSLRGPFDVSSNRPSNLNLFNIYFLADIFLQTQLIFETFYAIGGSHGQFIFPTCRRPVFQLIPKCEAQFYVFTTNANRTAEKKKHSLCDLKLIFERRNTTKEFINILSNTNWSYIYLRIKRLEQKISAKVKLFVYQISNFGG